MCTPRSPSTASPKPWDSRRPASPTLRSQAPVFGVSLGLGFQAWSSVVDWPLNIGGKSYLALPALVPVTFELGVLLAAFATVTALVIWSRLRPRGKTPDSQPLAGASDDRFVILVREDDAGFDPVAFRAATHRLGIEDVIEGWKVG